MKKEKKERKQKRERGSLRPYQVGAGMVASGDRPLVLMYKENNGDWDYYLFMEVVNLHDAMDEEYINKYLVELQAVSPVAAGEKKLKEAFDFSRQKENERKIEDLSEYEKAEMLEEYGYSAPVWTKEGNNLKDIIREAIQKSEKIKFLFGFYMDRPVNRMGATGWDAIRGNIGI